MSKYFSLTWLAIATMTAGVMAQTGTVPLDSGTPPSGLTNSNITVLNGNVGIGTSSPRNNLHISGEADTDIGIWIENDSAAAVSGSIPVFSLIQAGSSGWGVPEWANASIIEANTTGGLVLDSYGYNGGPIIFQMNRAPKVFIDQSGKVGIGTTSPAYTLDVAGRIHSSTGGVVFPDGTTQTTAFIPANCGADYAESVGVGGDRGEYEPGDVLVIDPDNPDSFLKSNQAYSTMVAGVYSTQPGFVGRRHPASDPASKDEVPMAMVGRAPTKVSAENGPIKVGDLLVTSSTMGYAMKGTDRSQLTGAVVGKALGSLDSGTGTILVLVTLQ